MPVPCVFEAGRASLPSAGVAAGQPAAELLSSALRTAWTGQRRADGVRGRAALCMLCAVLCRWMSSTCSTATACCALCHAVQVSVRGGFHQPVVLQPRGGFVRGARLPGWGGPASDQAHRKGGAAWKGTSRGLAGSLACGRSGMDWPRERLKRLAWPHRRMQALAAGALVACPKRHTCTRPPPADRAQVRGAQL